jgi:hypothetical protein
MRNGSTIVRNGWSLIVWPSLEPGLPGPARLGSRSRAAARRQCLAWAAQTPGTGCITGAQGCGVIAMAMGLRQLMMGGPAVLVAVWIGVTVAES